LSSSGSLHSSALRLQDILIGVSSLYFSFSLFVLPTSILYLPY
jgi:hypothetical protein